MFCKICGTNNVPQAVFCENCGARISDDYTYSPARSYAYAETEEPAQEYNEYEAEPIYEFEPDEEAPKKKINIPLIVLLVLIGIIVCGLIGYFSWQLLSDNSIGINDNSASVSQEETEVEEQPQEEEVDAQTEKEKKLCKDLVIGVMEAVVEGNSEVVEEHLGFEVGTQDEMVAATSKRIAREFSFSGGEFDAASQKLVKEYYYGMDWRVTEVSEDRGEYVVVVSFTRLDKEEIEDELKEFDFEDYREDIEEEYRQNGTITDEMSNEEIDQKLSAACSAKATEIVDSAISGAELIEDELEFTVAKDEGEWFIVKDKSIFGKLRKEMGI